MPHPSPLPSVPALCLEHHFPSRAQFSHMCEADTHCPPTLGRLARDDWGVLGTKRSLPRRRVGVQQRGWGPGATRIMGTCSNTLLQPGVFRGQDRQVRGALAPAEAESSAVTHLLQAQAGCSTLLSRGRHWAIGSPLHTGCPTPSCEWQPGGPFPQAHPSYREFKRAPPSTPAKAALERPAWLGRLPGSLQAKGPEVQGPGLSGESWVSLSSLTLIANTLFILRCLLSSPTVKAHFPLQFA